MKQERITPPAPPALCRFITHFPLYSSKHALAINASPPTKTRINPHINSNTTAIYVIDIRKSNVVRLGHDPAVAQ
uniref:Uncharacterized protein n=1 Tax=Anguilla anguilla TaxID=7936 RepID=A0A0E9UI86_ANGAN